MRALLMSTARSASFFSFLAASPLAASVSPSNSRTCLSNRHAASNCSCVGDGAGDVRPARSHTSEFELGREGLDLGVVDVNLGLGVVDFLPA